MENKIKDMNSTILYKYLPKNVQLELVNIAHNIMEVPKGLLLLDRAKTVMKKTLDESQSENLDKLTERFIKLIVSTPLKDYISSITLPEDTLRIMEDRTSYKALLNFLDDQGYILGFQASIGKAGLFTTDDTIILGLEDLEKKCKKYKNQGFKFAVWTHSIKIGINTPTLNTITYNTNSCAKFAFVCQAHSIVPIVRIDISEEGSHTLETARKFLEKALTLMFRSFGEEHIFLEGLILQSTLVKSGNQLQNKDSSDDRAVATLATFSKTVSTAIHGIQIVSTSLSEKEEEMNINAVFNRYREKKPWPIAFAFGQNLLDVLLNTWKGRIDNAPLAQKILEFRVRNIMNITLGNYEKIRRYHPDEEEIDV